MNRRRSHSLLLFRIRWLFRSHTSRPSHGGEPLSPGLGLDTFFKCAVSVRKHAKDMVGDDIVSPNFGSTAEGDQYQSFDGINLLLYPRQVVSWKPYNCGQLMPKPLST
ncbi:hypothetical protein DsansV1_C18g0154161 [Dioscorea sansibarensis]